VAVLLAAAAAGLSFAFVPAAATKATGPRLVGPAPGRERIRFTLVLRPPGAARVERAISAIEDPRSPHFGHFLSPQAVGAHFGLSTARLSALERALEARRLEVSASFQQRTELVVAGHVATVERLLRVRTGTYVDTSGHRSHAPLGRPTIPASLKDVAAVTGLDTRPHWRARDVPVGGLTR
jgi:subtilase family serine protease